MSFNTSFISSRKHYQMIMLPRSKNNFNYINRQFVLSEGLKKIQEIKAAPGSKLRQYIDEINTLYPQEII